MSADITKFPVSNKELELEAIEAFNINHSSTINGVPVEKPKSRQQYLKLCKDFLEIQDYQDVLCGIMDDEHYEALEPQLQKVINCYYSFNK